jgi:hypothetical protein
MLIENTQKTVLLDDAAKQGISRFELMSIPETYQKMLGSVDKQFGMPMAPLYKAVTGEKINVESMSKFFKGFDRDVRVAKTALVDLKTRLEFTKNEFWVRTQILKNKANYLQHTADLEKYKGSNSAVWAYGDSFTSTALVDMVRSSAWIDTSEGIVFLPSSTEDSSITPQQITVAGFTWAPGSDPLGSSPALAVDGLENTSWKALFTAPGACSADFLFKDVVDLSTIQIDPTGYGMTATVSVDNGTGFVNIVQEVIYKKTTLIVSVQKAKRVRITFAPVDTILPKSVGIRNIRFFKNSSSNKASLYTSEITIPVTYSEMKLDFTGKIPASSAIKPYYSFDNVKWNLVTNGWMQVQDNPTITTSLDRSLVVKEGGYYSIPVDKNPRAFTSGSLLIGKNQVEVTAFRKDYVALGEVPHTPTKNDFDSQDARKFKSWFSVPSLHERAYSNRIFVKPFFNQTTVVKKGADILPFQYHVGEEIYADMGFLMLQGGPANNICQPNHSYKTSFYVYSEQDYYVDFAKFFFYQGFRNRAFRTFTDVGKVLGSFSIYVNGAVITSSSKPSTIYTTSDADGSYLEGGINGTAEQGTSFSYTIKKGWNLVEILLHSIEPTVFGEDLGSDGYNPYLQLSLYPSLFDPAFQTDSGITKVVASGEEPPISEFELLWNAPQDYSFWAWSSTSTKILFNVWNTGAIDGALKGVGPNYDLIYQGVADNAPSISSVRFRFDLLRDQTANAEPILEEYKFSVR